MSTVQSVSNDASASILSALNVARENTGEAQGDLQNRFLTLLTTQIRNQDPLNPMDNAQMTSQLAQISTVDGIERLNTTLQALMANANDSEAFQATALVGHGVLVPGSGLQLDQGRAVGGIDLVESADRVRVIVTDANGLTVRTLDLGGLNAGSHAFQWDGKSDGGTEVAAGTYRFKAEATRGDSKVDTTALELGVVSSIVRGAKGVTLNVGTLGAFKLDDVRQII